MFAFFEKIIPLPIRNLFLERLDLQLNDLLDEIPQEAAMNN